MLPIERLEKIKEYIDEKGTVTISELTEVFKVSKATILRDLKRLDEQNLIIRAHGGATKVSKGTRFEPRHALKEKEAVDKKKHIAKYAKKFIFPGETIMLDSGSTTLMLAFQILQMENITVITNDIKIAMTLTENDNIDLVVLGGQRRKGVYSLIGPFTENIISNLNVDKVFLGADAVDIEKGITNSNIDETNIKKAMIDISKEVILLADSRKFNKTAFTKIADINVLDKIITDDGLEKTDRRLLAELDVELQIVNTNH